MPLNVLLADDSAVMRKMIARTLRLSGVALGEIVEAGDGIHALAVLARHRVDLALVDINMPVMDGEQLLDRIRADSLITALPVIVVSTESSAARVERLRGKGAHFIHKPFTPEQLRDIIHSVTGHDNDDTACHPAAAGGNLDF